MRSPQRADTVEHSDAAIDDGSAIVASGLTRRFGDLVAVDDLSFEVAPGEVFGILGHNGAGKTTTIRLLNGMLLPHGGSVRVLGMDPLTDGERLRRRTGVLTSTPALDLPLTPRENLRTYGTISGVDDRVLDNRIQALVERFELEEHADKPSKALSTGLRQRVALARALLHEPDVVFLDEPTSAIDPLAARKVRRLISELSREGGRTIVLCTHNLVEAEEVCDRVAIIERGGLVAVGNPADLARKLRGRPTLRLDVGDATLDSVRTAVGRLPEVEVARTDHGFVEVRHGGRDAVPGIVASLVQHGIGVYSIADVTPTLEDVYIALHEPDDRNS